MRIAITIMMTVAVFSLYLADQPGRFDRVLKLVTNTTEDFFYNHKLIISGNELVSVEEIEALLPKQHSVLWWYFNGPRISAALMKHPLVSAARVNSCGRISWGCFEINIEERMPELVTMVGSTPWLVSREGEFIEPLSKNKFSYRRAGLKPILIEGAIRESLSPDQVKARFGFVYKLINRLKKEINLEIQRVSLTKSGEVELYFHGYDFPVIFAAPGRGSADIADQVERLKILVKRFDKDLKKLRKIDLGFGRLAVVKMKESATEGQPAG
ncbi:MAG: FtsQ-type POTRA domain-containing protein [Candidatus Dadabacteria bacterium]|nr:MAG: FtsQ-type POTRA domain-containing protein [Candidatus Dadabacteria bacterium]